MRYQVHKKAPHNLLHLVFIVSVGCCCSCNGQQNKTDSIGAKDTTLKKGIQADMSLPGSFSTQTAIHFDSTELSKFMKRYPDFSIFEKRMQRFYTRRDYAYAWFDNKGLIEQAGNLYNKVNNIKAEGWPGTLLYSDDFHSMMDEDSKILDVSKANTDVELMLTAQYFFYAEKIWKGLGTEGMKAVEWDLPQKKVSYGVLLDSFLRMPADQFMSAAPVYPQYDKLKKYLKKYNDIEKENKWEPIKADKKSYQKDDSSAVIAMIRQRLYVAGDLSEDNKSAIFDEVLAVAVKNFQQRYGLNDDGVINTAFINALNYPLSKRIEQIMVNMERSRWLPLTTSKNYFVVNIPEYRFHAFENDTVAWNMNVVVGTSVNKTAIFSGMISSVVFSPYWNIPPGIMQKETLPAIRRDKNYLAKNHMEWNGKSVRQKPGPWNALGKVKFLFPNSHNIYLHDTPSQWAFKKEERAFSHGCIRVSDPKRLAMYILRKQPEWTEQKVVSSMNASREQYVKVVDPVPVLIAYFTAWVDGKGRLNFRNDVYKRDSRLANMIMQ